MPQPKASEGFAHTAEEVAAWLSAQEGRTVTIVDVWKIEAQALRKLRAEFARRRMSSRDLLPDR
ncbi:hypothetical protein [Propionivibrio sp.]|uniref:hypothetical protein n=1 Tax=Propionivibrio sp. TaxID=2212460 RepID=UPI002602C06D|nr:hypothetical protein [Propionivibrio sp.]